MGDATWRKGYRRTAETCEVVVARAQSGTLMGVAGFSYTAVGGGVVAFGVSRIKTGFGVEEERSGCGRSGTSTLKEGGLSRGGPLRGTGSSDNSVTNDVCE
jgi:hypothetical protein